MSKSFKNPSSLKSNNGSVPVVVVGGPQPPSKQPKLTRNESVVKTPSISVDSESTPEMLPLHHPQKKATPPLPPTATVLPGTKAQDLGESEAGGDSTSSAPTRAPRDPHGHKLIKVIDVQTAAHKTKYLPLGDGQYTYSLLMQPLNIQECGKNWCEVEMLEMINGSTTISSSRIYSVDAEDLLRMCYLHAMAQRDLNGDPRLHYEQWVLTVFQEYCASCGSADYTERGAIARCYLESIRYCFAIGSDPAHRLQMFFQKRCIRDLNLGGINEFVKQSRSFENPNIVQGKSPKSKFEYQIEGYIMCVPALADMNSTKMEKEEEGDEAMEANEEEAA